MVCLSLVVDISVVTNAYLKELPGPGGNFGISAGVSSKSEDISQTLGHTNVDRSTELWGLF